MLFRSLVPEKRTEVTTEGGLDVIGGGDLLRSRVAALTEAGIRVSLFIDPDIKQIEQAAAIGAPVIELHTGAYAEADAKGRIGELRRIKAAARAGVELGLVVNAGHGLDYHNVQPVAAIPEITELNIGFAIIARAIFCGLDPAVREMKRLMMEARRDRKSTRLNSSH